MMTHRRMEAVRSESEPESGRMVNLALGQNRILERIVLGAPLEKTLDALLRLLEQDTPEMLCSVLQLDPDGVHLRHAAAPSLPAEYSRAIDGASIGARAGSCGTAAYRREQVIVSDIETDPLWEDYRELARPHGLRACWSTPILDARGQVLGTFAMYFERVASPEPLHHRLIEIAVRVAAIAIGKDRREKEHQRLTRQLEENEERHRLVNLATNDAVWDWDLGKGTLWWNDGVRRLFGYSEEEVTSELDWWTSRVHPEDRDRVHHSLHEAAESLASSWHEEYRFLRKDGSYAYVQDRGYVMRDGVGAATRMIGSMSDITRRKTAEAKILELAYREPVTGLPNRAALQKRLTEVLEEADRSEQKIALLLLNLDGFRDINDSLGHQNGDLLLQVVAQRLSETVSGEVASLGGDEFAVLLPGARDSAEVESAVREIQATLQAPFQLGDIPIQTDATLGVALFPEDGTTVELLLQHADVALRTAKEKHESHLFYSAKIDHYDPQRLILLGELRSAIEEGQLVLHYQPKIDVPSGRVVGAEALVRWQHPTRGLIFPDTFIPLAERTGLINPLTVAVVVGALRQGVAFLDAGFLLDIAVNLSARNLHDPGFSKGLLDLVSSIGFPLSRLTLEVTETAIMADPVRAKAVLSEIHDAGIHLSMDDFGIGQSSLSYLKELPISKMKIDKSFVMDFDQPRNVAVVRSAIDLGRNMGLQVTAEGVEEEGVYHALKDFGCDLAQGYFFSKPLPVEAFSRWLCDSPWGYKSQARGEPALVV